MDERFKKLEDEYSRLKRQLAAGRITREHLDATLKTRMIEDVQGRYWTLAADSGKWRVYEGESWFDADPSGVKSAVKAVAATVVDTANRSHARPLARQVSIIAIGCAALLCLMLFAGLAWVARPEIAKTALRISLPTPFPSLPDIPRIGLFTSAASSTSVRTGSVRPTETVIVGFSIGPIACSSEFDETTQKPIGARPDKIIFLGAKRLYVSWPYRGVNPNDSYSYYWQYSGQQYIAGVHKFPNSSGIAWTFASAPEGQSLAPGKYRFEIRSGLTPITAEECIVILSDR